jgi:hypothetical protein
MLLLVECEIGTDIAKERRTVILRVKQYGAEGSDHRTVILRFKQKGAKGIGP